MLVFKMETNIEHLGTVREFGEIYNVIDISWDKSEFYLNNIPIYLITKDQLTIRILCSFDLSNAIKNGDKQLDKIWDNKVIRVIQEDGNSILRISGLTVIKKLE